MEYVTALWLPILLSGIFVFIASSIIHMALPLHRGDCRKLSGEDAMLDAMRKQALTPGEYMFPCPASMKDMSSPEMLEKYRSGPVGTLLVRPNGPPAIGKSLIQWFLFSLLVGLFAGYVGRVSLAPGATYLSVFRITGCVAVAGYAFGYIQDSIWRGVPWKTCLKYLFDSIIYALGTAAIFASLWPAAE